MMYNTLIEILQEEWPDSALALEKLTDKQRIEYIASLKMIERIKMLNEDTTKGKSNAKK